MFTSDFLKAPTKVWWSLLPAPVPPWRASPARVCPHHWWPSSGSWKIAARQRHQQDQVPPNPTGRFSSLVIQGSQSFNPVDTIGDYAQQKKEANAIGDNAEILWAQCLLARGQQLLIFTVHCGKLAAKIANHVDVLLLQAILNYGQLSYKVLVHSNSMLIMFRSDWVVSMSFNWCSLYFELVAYGDVLLILFIASIVLYSCWMWPCVCYSCKVPVDKG